MAKKQVQKMSPETLKKLAGLLPANSKYTVKFTPDHYNEIPEELRPVFTLKPWKQKELAKLADIGEDAELAMDAVASQVIGWSNVWELGEDEPTEVEYEADSKGGLKRELLDIFPQKITVALLNELTRISGVS